MAARLSLFMKLFYSLVAATALAFSMNPATGDRTMWDVSAPAHPVAKATRHFSEWHRNFQQGGAVR